MVEIIYLPRGKWGDLAEKMADEWEKRGTIQFVEPYKISREFFISELAELIRNQKAVEVI